MQFSRTSARREQEELVIEIDRADIRTWKDRWWMLICCRACRRRRNPKQSRCTIDFDWAVAERRRAVAVGPISLETYFENDRLAKKLEVTKAQFFVRARSRATTLVFVFAILNYRHRDGWRRRSILLQPTRTCRYTRRLGKSVRAAACPHAALARR